MGHTVVNIERTPGRENGFEATESVAVIFTQASLSVSRTVADGQSAAFTLSA